MTTLTNTTDIRIPPTKYYPEETFPSLTTYFDGSTCLLCLSPNTGGIIFKASVNIHKCPPASGCIWLKGWSENTGLPEALAKAGLVHLTGRAVACGHAEAQEAELLI